jgi:hypothetical protein
LSQQVCEKIAAKISDGAIDDLRRGNPPSPPLIPQLMSFKSNQPRGLFLGECQPIAERSAKFVQLGKGGLDGPRNDGLEFGGVEGYLHGRSRFSRLRARLASSAAAIIRSTASSN